MWDEYGSIFDRLSGDSSVRCIVLSGAGEKAFTAGLDLEMNMEMVGGRAKGDEEAPVDPARKAWALRKHIQEFQDAISAAERCDKRMPFPCFHFLFLFLPSSPPGSCRPMRSEY